MNENGYELSDEQAYAMFGESPPKPIAARRQDVKPPIEASDEDLSKWANEASDIATDGSTETSGE